MKSTRNLELMIPSLALELLKCLFEEVIRQKGKDDNKYPIPQNGKDYISSLIGYPSNLLFNATKSGNSRFLTELIHSYPFLVQELDENNRSIFHAAILHCHTSTFNLIYEMGFNKELLTTIVDADKNTMLHLAAKYPYHSQVGGLSSAALEMQQEFLLFEVEKRMQPSFRNMKNAQRLTSKELFTREHKSLMKSEEKWMRNTTSSRMVVATLIAMVVFSANFIVPGDYNNVTRTPLLLEKDFFLVFVISDAVALSSS
ncbi:hypothetical protein LWI28_020281 [Acer negundo]|uniref:PGG domain-containing protein n=1 Tax=Acer negundo TaxID=4023 RepID=A0AAD5ISZ7_ACENE|nr:hypothetical protein LWI28_020281 [Acer negundo]